MNCLKAMCVASLLTMVCVRALATSYTDNCIVYSCPHCGAKAHEAEYASWNTFGAVCWSDGFMIAPMAPTRDLVARCWKCRKAFDKFHIKSTKVPRNQLLKDSATKIEWIGDFEAVNEVLTDGKGALDLDFEAALRVRMLWASNHAQRKTTVVGRKRGMDAVEGLKIEKISELEIRENMLRLSAMTNLPLLLRAEVRREIGDFAGAKAMLNEYDSQGHDDGKEFCQEMKKRIDCKDRGVFLCGK